MCDSGVTLKRGIRCWSLFGVKGLTDINAYLSFNQISQNKYLHQSKIPSQREKQILSQDVVFLHQTREILILMW